MDDTLFTQPNVARYLLRAIRDEGVEHAFMVTGYKIAPFLSQFDEAKVTPIVACHEAGAVYMADGYARATKNFGVAMGIGAMAVTMLRLPLTSVLLTAVSSGATKSTSF